MTDVIIEVIVQAVGAIALMAITLLGTWLTSLIGKKAALTNINLAKDEVIGAAQLTVEELQQTMVEGLKAAHEDGKLTNDEIAELGKQLLEGTWAKMSKPTADLLEAAGVDLVNLIQGAGEAWLLELKKEKAA